MTAMPVENSVTRQVVADGTDNNWPSVPTTPQDNNWPSVPTTPQDNNWPTAPTAPQDNNWPSESPGL
ncbi:hypothetical protein [Streptomyces coeruleorubidus]|uniref:hypothetical protein n=1 Tax=Streptomyces coeruleorubidus TaxID=116188 RepID=UPI003655FD0C